MRRILPLSIFILLFFQVTAIAFEATSNDTTIFVFSDKTINKRVTVITSGKKEIELPVALNLNNLLKTLGIDSLEREKAIVITGENTNDTLVVISKYGDKIQIVSKKDKPFEFQEEPYSIGDSIEQEHSNNKTNSFFSKKDFGIYLGLNGLLNNGTVSPKQRYQLKEWKSRYIAMSFRKNQTFLNSSKADFALSYGPELAIYNYRILNSNVVLNKGGQTTFEDAGFYTKKSKLVIPYLSFPILINVGFKESGIRLGIGGYAGYRLGAHTKVKSEEGNKEKVKNNYNLNNLKYGLTGEIGKKNGISVFVRYDLNKLFKTDQIYVQQLQAFSFGVRL
jgi:hypothetical protein